ncbi:MAG: endonuclease/exonuclease/phosphatase family protein [Planctomycetaceae bacterium]
MHFRLSLLIPVLTLCAATASAAEEFTVAFWNVENLFDTVDDPDVEKDEEFTPSQPKKWTAERLQIKLRNLTRVISDMHDGQGPALLGLSEVENRKVVEMLVEHLKPLKRDYGIVHQDSPSFRGIDCALIYDRKMFKLEESRFLRIEGETTRDIVEARLSINGQPLTIFVNHWPSRRSPDPARIKVAGVLRARIDQLLKRNPAADFVIVGDLNDTPANKSVGSTLRTWGNPDQLRPGVLFNSMWDHHQSGTGTYVYRNRWDILDHVILAPGMLDQKGFHWVKDSTHTVQRKYQMFVPNSDRYIPSPSRSYTGNSFHANGFSDHLPVACRVRLDQ